MDRQRDGDCVDRQEGQTEGRKDSTRLLSTYSFCRAFPFFFFEKEREEETNKSNVWNPLIAAAQAAA